jgi:hypothetical protein
MLPENCRPAAVSHDAILNKLLLEKQQLFYYQVLNTGLQI